MNSRHLGTTRNSTVKRKKGWWSIFKRNIRNEACKRIENEKVEKYQDLKREIARMWNMRTEQVVPIVVGSLGSVTKSLDKWLGKLDVKIGISLLQKTTLLGKARILRKVLEL